MPGTIVSAKAFYNGGRKRMRRGRRLSFFVLKIFCLPIRLCSFAKLEPSKLHSPNRTNYLPECLSAAFGICYSAPVAKLDE